MTVGHRAWLRHYLAVRPQANPCSSLGLRQEGRYSEPSTGTLDLGPLYCLGLPPFTVHT